MVEPLGGAPRRDELAVDYAVFHRGKRAVELDVLSPSTEREQLLTAADVLIETWAPTEAAKHGLDRQTLHARHPALVQCSITGFGADGPYRDVAARESLVHALIGTMGEQVGHRDGPIYEGYRLPRSGPVISGHSVCSRHFSAGPVTEWGVMSKPPCTTAPWSIWR